MKNESDGLFFIKLRGYQQKTPIVPVNLEHSFNEKLIATGKIQIFKTIPRNLRKLETVE